jgi:hypothetical protein
MTSPSTPSPIAHLVTPVLDAYLDAAIWADLRDADGNPLDDLYDHTDLHPDAIATATLDVIDFLTTAHQEGLLDQLEAAEVTTDQIGHDFWLTRNRHGVGFWDRGLGQLGTDLTNLAQPYGEQYLFILEDKIHIE